MSRSRFVIGIDLGTTNCALCFVDTRDPAHQGIQTFDVTQVFSPGEVGKGRLLPSFIYLSTDQEKKGGLLNLPWDPFGERVVGEYARARGAEVPGRLVFSAKSWLSQQGVDRTAAILPTDAPEDVQKLSPIVASATFLRHLKAAWNHTIGREQSENLEDQEIYITIPASFDAVARDLTVKAARSAGLEDITLLEEPQAAFYAWLESNPLEWKDAMDPGDLILVCDIGGGTTDFSLIQIVSDRGNLGLERVAVGEHLLLGGDNMDLALAYSLREGLKGRGQALDQGQFQHLWHNVRLAKERLLSDNSLAEVPVIIPGRGKGLVAGTIRSGLSRDMVESLILEGFVPEVGPDDAPREQPRAGLQELGLSYADDTAITRHLAGFLKLHSQGGKAARPAAVLFNGGVLKAGIIRRRILDILRSWYPGEDSGKISELVNPDMDLAVARGAAYYGLVRRGEGIRIRSGIARSCYIGIQGARPAVPGMPSPLKALCVVAQGMEEGAKVALPGRTFGLVVGQPVEFRFLQSGIRPDDKVGDLIDEWEGTIEPVSSVQTEVETPDLAPGTVIPVELEAEVTDVGTLALGFVSRQRGLRFDLEFNVRGQDSGG